MSDDNFIGRWSRLKRETESEKRRAEKPSQAPPEARTEQPAAASAQPSAAPGETHRDATPPFDPATLPSIDSIVAGTDIRAFLQKGVPAELTKAALRRAWTTDPAIRDFIEIAENQWDFTDPASIPGFGTLKAGDEVRQLASQAIGKPLEAPPPVGLTGEEEETPIRRTVSRRPMSCGRGSSLRRSARAPTIKTPLPLLRRSMRSRPPTAAPRRNARGTAPQCRDKRHSLKRWDETYRLPHSLRLWPSLNAALP